jgi:hypothetical protein
MSPALEEAAAAYRHFARLIYGEYAYAPRR